MIHTWGIGLVLALAAQGVHARQLAASSLSRQIDLHGAKATANRMTDAEWEYVLKEVDEGKSEWIAIVPKLAPGTDAGDAEGLGIALAFALPKNPQAVLSAIDPQDGPVLGVSRVCSVPFIEGTMDDIPRYIRAAKAAVASINLPALASVKTSCLQTLQRVDAAPSPAH